MAKDTSVDLRNQVIYQVFPRQFSATANFKGVTKELDRIQKLGVDILYLLPIHPIGNFHKKGTLGCPYSIMDYRKINPDLGTMKDFKELISEAHKRDIKVMIDIVFNHTSKDSYILNAHPEWMFRKNGEISSKVGDWWDVTDLDFSNLALWNELLRVLRYWAKQGIDGYRCDVASMIPLDFWILARKELKKINSNFILLAESIDFNFIKEIRDAGFDAASDCELYQAFDMEYDYDIWSLYDKFLKTKEGLKDWVKGLKCQESLYPKNYIKVHALENHDRERITNFIQDEAQLKNFTALIYLLKGATFLYAGQEACDKKMESLFDLDPIDWSTLGKYGMSEFMRRCYQIKKDPIVLEGIYKIHDTDQDVIHLTYCFGKDVLECIFNMGNVEGSISTTLLDGRYINIINDEMLEIKDGKLTIDKNPVVMKGQNTFLILK